MPSSTRLAIVPFSRWREKDRSPDLVKVHSVAWGEVSFEDANGSDAGVKAQMREADFCEKYRPPQGRDSSEVFYAAEMYEREESRNEVIVLRIHPHEIVYAEIIGKDHGSETCMTQADFLKKFEPLDG